MKTLKTITQWTVLIVLLALYFGPTFAARNGAGTYTIPNVFSPGDTITASSHNQNFSDIAAELTNSVAADGQTSMTGPLKAAAGAVSAPSLAFASDTDTGLYRSAANELSASAGGVQIAAINASGVNAVAGKLMEAGAALIPPGTILPYGGSSAPTGYLLCDGSAVSRDAYAALFTAYGTTYGTGDGSTTFNLPDCTGRVIAGRESTATRLTTAGSGIDGDTLGATGGAETHTLTTAQMPTHNHTINITDPGHSHTVEYQQNGIPSGSFVNNRVSAINTGFPSSGNTVSATTGITATSDSVGGGEAHNNVQPTIVLNYIIKH